MMPPGSQVSADAFNHSEYELSIQAALPPLVPSVLLQWGFLLECRHQASVLQDSPVPLPRLVSLVCHKWVGRPHQGEYARVSEQ